jgi:hypothetical protein
MRSWNPPLTTISAIAATPRWAYVATYFGQVRAVDAATGEFGPWRVSVNNYADALAARDNIVYLGGGFTTALGEPRTGLAAIDDPSMLLDVPVPERREELSITPNPFAVSAHVRLTLSHATKVELALVDVSGRRVASLLVNGTLVAGRHDVPLDGRALPVGVYWLQTTLDGATQSRRVVIVR